MACSLMLTEKVLFAALTIILTVVAIAPYVMSFVWFRREDQKAPPKGGA